MARCLALTMGLATFVVAGCSVQLTDKNGGPFDKRARVRRFLEAVHADRRDIAAELVSPKLLAEAPLEAIIERVHIVEEVHGPYVGLADRFQTNEGTDVSTIEMEVLFQRGTTKGSFRFDREGKEWKLRGFQLDLDRYPVATREEVDRFAAVVVDAFRENRPADIYALLSPAAKSAHPVPRFEAKWKELQEKVGRVVAVRVLARAPTGTQLLVGQMIGERADLRAYVEVLHLGGKPVLMNDPFVDATPLVPEADQDAARRAGAEFVAQLANGSPGDSICAAVTAAWRQAMPCQVLPDVFALRYRSLGRFVAMREPWAAVREADFVRFDAQLEFAGATRPAWFQAREEEGRWKIRAFEILIDKFPDVEAVAAERVLRELVDLYEADRRDAFYDRLSPVLRATMSAGDLATMWQDCKAHSGSVRKVTSVRPERAPGVPLKLVAEVETSKEPLRFSVEFFSLDGRPVVTGFRFYFPSLGERVFGF